MKKYLILLFISILDIFILNSTLVDYLIYAVFFFAITDFLRNLTRKINFFDIVGNIACLIYLIAPLFVYKLEGPTRSLAKLWQTMMVIDKTEYFAYALPGTLMLIIGLNFSGNRIQPSQDRLILNRCRLYLKDKAFIGFLLMGIGLASSFAKGFLPASLDSVLYFFNQLTFVGVLYILFSGISGKTWWLFIGLGLLISQSLVTAMYSELIFWSIFGGIILIVGKTQHSFWMKLALILVGGFGIILIQSVKHEFRKDISGRSPKESNIAYFYSLLQTRLSKPESIFTPARNFGMITRANQGLFIGQAILYVPRHEEFAYGETIIKSVLASIVPRFVWPDKPEAGGRDYVCRFLGDCAKKRYSYDIGQLGEAYVNFGKLGGIFFMFIYGWFIKYTYNKISRLCWRFPTLILWVPLFYFMVLSLETDVITFLNAFVKSIIFAFFCFVTFRWIFKIRL